MQSLLPSLPAVEAYAERVVWISGITTTLIFVAEYAILIALTGASFGHRLLRLKVVDFSHGGLPTIRQALIRTGLMAIVITAITYDEDGRGIHERFSQTKLERA